MRRQLKPLQPPKIKFADEAIMLPDDQPFDPAAEKQREKLRKAKEEERLKKQQEEDERNARWVYSPLLSPHHLLLNNLFALGA